MYEKGFGLNIHDDFLFYFADRCNRMSVLITRVCLVVDIHQMGRVDSRIGLGGGQAGVAKQFLDRPQVTASRQQMSGKAMAHRVRCGGGRQAKLHPRPFHDFLYRPRV